MSNCIKKDCYKKLFYGMCASCGDDKLNYKTIKPKPVRGRRLSMLIYDYDKDGNDVLNIPKGE